MANTNIKILMQIRMAEATTGGGELTPINIILETLKLTILDRLKILAK